MFPGSIPTARAIVKNANVGENLTPVTLELGGKSPAVILRSALYSTGWFLDESANRARFKMLMTRLWRAKLSNCGQTCVAPDYALVHVDCLTDFVEIAEELVEELCGPDKHVMLYRSVGTEAAGQFLVVPYPRVMNERVIGGIWPGRTSTSRDVVRGGKRARPRVPFPRTGLVTGYPHHVGLFRDRSAAAGQLVPACDQRAPPQTVSEGAGCQRGEKDQIVQRGRGRGRAGSVLSGRSGPIGWMIVCSIIVVVTVFLLCPPAALGTIFHINLPQDFLPSSELPRAYAAAFRRLRWHDAERPDLPSRAFRSASARPRLWPSVHRAHHPRRRSLPQVPRPPSSG